MTRFPIVINFGSRSRCTLLAALVITAVWGCAVRAYTPDSPEVLAMIERGIKFIENFDKLATSVDQQMGGICLCGLAVLKYGSDLEHPLVRAAIAKCREACRTGVRWSEHNNYSLGIAIVFLCEVDTQLYHPEIERLLSEAYRRQQRGGGWGYEGGQTGDTSQTQYIVLGLWMAHRSGIPVQQHVVERVCEWLFRTQAPDGAFGYQANDPGTYARVAQNPTMPSMGAAGAGSLYACAQMLGLVQRPKEKDAGVPAALREIGEDDTGPTATVIDERLLIKAINDANRWFATHGTPTNPIHQYYYMYSVERYWAFRGHAESIRDQSPAWYNAGVNYLRENQGADGSWHAVVEYGHLVDTAFAVLFLQRGSRMMIQQRTEESGRLRGGKTLPKDLMQIRLDEETGQVRDNREASSIEEMLKLLEDENQPQSDFLGGVPEKLSLSDDPQTRAAQSARLRRLARGGSFQARLTAVKTLSRDRNLENVPALIFALSDPDARVARAALDGLRFISRKLDGFGLPDAPTLQQMQVSQKQWSDWLRSLQPEASLNP